MGWDVVMSPKSRGGLGVRLAREANTSMLGKLVWAMHQNSYKPWVEVLAVNMLVQPLHGIEKEARFFCLEFDPKGQVSYTRWLWFFG